MYPFNILIGQFLITNYSLFHFLGLALLVTFEVALLDKDALVKRWQVLVACLVGIVTGTTGAKLTHLLLYAENYKGMSPEQVFLTSGHAYIGGAFLALLAIYILFRYYKVSFLYAGDYTLPYFGLFRAFGRVGCLLTGCCGGSVSNLPWASYFRDGILRHPTQAYMIIITFSIFVAGRLNYKRLRDTPGIVFFSSVAMYGIGRFFVEFLRIDSPFVLGPLKFSHIILFAVSAYGLAGLYILYKRYSQEGKPAALFIKQLFSAFIFSLVIVGVLILTALSFIPKINYKEEITFKIGTKGITRQEAKEGLAIPNTEKIRNAIERYKGDNGIYPTQEQGLSALVNKPAAKPIPANWRGPYIDKSLLLSKDGKPYEYILERYGDTWSYKILSPIVTSPAVEKGIGVPPVKKPVYTLEVEMHHALARYKLDNGRYPTQAQGLEALVKKPDMEPIPANWRGPYLEGPLKDKRAKAYKYKIEEKAGAQAYSIYTE